MEKVSITKISVFKNIRYLLRFIWSENKYLLLMLLIYSLCGAVMPLLEIYLPKLAIELMTSKAKKITIITQLGGYALVMAAVYFAGNFSQRSQYFHINNLRAAFMTKIFIKSLYCDYGDLESTEGQRRYQRALSAVLAGDGSATSRMIPALLELTVGVIGFSVYSGFLLTLHPIVIVLLILSSLTTYFTMRSAVKFERSHKDESSDLTKKFSYLSNKTADAAYGKDIRLYKTGLLLSALRDGLIEKSYILYKKIQGKWMISKTVDAGAALLRDGLSYIYLIWMVTGGRLTPAEFILYFGAITGFSNWLNSILNQVSEISGAHLEIADIREYLERDDSHIPENASDPPELSNPPHIVFDEVTFSYPESKKPVLDKFCLDIKPNEKVALVGENGVGKTTLVKLLCGFYKPDSGRILINGVDINRFRREDLFTLFSAVFQDIFIMPFTLAENVAVQSGDILDRDKVIGCLEKAGLWGYVKTLPENIDTMMLRYNDEKGIMLSGGQQQKLLLARALYKNAPMLILDEPTAALDPIAESELYRQFHSYSADKTALYISHRLASTRFCDRIVYLDRGRAEEVGTHEELVRLGGKYAKMFEIQSHYYKNQPEVTAK